MCGAYALESFSKASDTAEFFSSPTLDIVPYPRLSCLLFTAVARKAATGQVRPPNRRMLNDMKTVATALPYCDALFVDNEVVGLLNEEPVHWRLRFPTRIFSPNRHENLLAYLDELHEAVPDEHVDLVREVYGESRLQPFAGVFDSQ
jgi:hypothetical protein